MNLQRRTLLSGLAFAALIGLPAGTIAAIPISIDVNIGRHCASGIGPPNKTLTATLRTATGKFRDRQVVQTGFETGSWVVCFGAGTEAVYGINGGDRMRVAIGRQSRTVEVPRLRPIIDRIQDSIEGWAVPNSEVILVVTHYESYSESVDLSYEVTADGSGHYAVDTTADVDLLGGDLVLALNLSAGDSFSAVIEVPHVAIEHGNNRLTGSASSGTHLELLLTDAHSVEKARVSLGPSQGGGGFTAEMYDEDGRAVYPDGGDWLIGSFAADAELELPYSHLRGRASDDVVTGRCMSNAPYQLRAEFVSFYGKTDASGRLWRDLTSAFDLKRSSRLELFCLYPSGDEWKRKGVVN